MWQDCGNENMTGVMTTHQNVTVDPQAEQQANQGQTLLEMIMADALLLAMSTAEGRQRMTANLHPLATRALFLGTHGRMTNEELLTVLRPATPSGDVGRDMRETRNLRSVGKERGLKLGDLRRNALNLLSSGSMPKADVGRYAKLCIATHQRQSSHAIDRVEADDRPTSVARGHASGASTSRSRIRSSRGRGVSYARRCMNSSGGITMWVVPSREEPGHATLSAGVAEKGWRPARAVTVSDARVR